MLEIGRTVKIISTEGVQFTENCSENKKARFYRDYKINRWTIHFMNPGEQEPRGLVLINEEGLYASLMSDCVRETVKVYLSGPITGHQDGNREVFDVYKENLINLGFDVINPHELDIQHCKTHEDFMAVDLPELLKCDAIAFMPDRGVDGEYKWISSRGCKTEMIAALRTGKKIINAKTGKESREFLMVIEVHALKK